MPLPLALAESGDRSRWHHALAQSLKGLAKNPMIVAIVAGIVCSALDIHLPAFVESTIALVTTAASPVALFVIGGSLVGLRLEAQRTDIAAVALGKLIVHPMLVMGALVGAGD